MKEIKNIRSIFGAGVVLALLFSAGVAMSSPTKIASTIIANENEAPQNPLVYTHTVLAEEITATWCQWCPYVMSVLWNEYNSGQYDFNFVALVCDKNSYANARRIELSVGAYPYMVYDNGYIRIEGWTGSATAYNNALNSCGARAVKDIDIALDITWEGSALVGVNVDVINNEGTTYTGHIHAYVTEINSRWTNQYDGQYHFAMIGNYALNQAISVPATGSSHYASTWNGNLYGMGDIVQNNIMVIVSVFRTGSSTYADDTAAATPLINNPPNAPDQPTGPTKGIVGTTYSYSTQTTDPNNDNVYYLLDWGDSTNSGWLGPYPSGAPVTATHSWSSFGIYNIQVKSKDIHNVESAWSSPLPVRMYLVGDTNPNDDVGFDDINPFVLMLTGGEAAYYAQYPDGYFYTGDINQDGAVNFGDINPFVALLTSG